MEEDALLAGEPGGEGGRRASQRNCGERWLVFLFIELLEELGGATTAPEFVPDGVVGTEILIAVETGYLMKRSH